MIDLSRIYYLAGPMRGMPDHNFPEFKRVARRLRATGVTIITPAEINPAAAEYAAQNPGEYRYEYLARDIARLAQDCTGLILMEGWTNSEGARAELQVALALRYPVFFASESGYRLVEM